jgi:hypothetical protein
MQNSGCYHFLKIYNIILWFWFNALMPGKNLIYLPSMRTRDSTLVQTYAIWYWLEPHPNSILVLTYAISQFHIATDLCNIQIPHLYRLMPYPNSTSEHRLMKYPNSTSVLTHQSAYLNKGHISVFESLTRTRPRYVHLFLVMMVPKNV